MTPAGLTTATASPLLDELAAVQRDAVNQALPGLQPDRVGRVLNRPETVSLIEQSAAFPERQSRMLSKRVTSTHSTSNEGFDQRVEVRHVAPRRASIGVVGRTADQKHGGIDSAFWWRNTQRGSRLREASRASVPGRGEGAMVANLPDSDMSRELSALSESVALNFPIASKDEFVTQMLAHRPTVDFAGRTYDTAFAARLIPGFFFPLADRNDLLHKVGELVTARGLTGGPTNDGK